MGSDSRLSSGSENIGNTWLEQDVYRARDTKTSSNAPSVPAQKTKAVESSAAEKVKQASSWTASGSNASRDANGGEVSAIHTPRHKENSKIQFLKHYFQSTNP